MLVWCCVLGQLWFRPLAYAHFLVVTHNNSAVKSLNRSEAEQLYLGKRTILDNGSKVVLFDLPRGDTRNGFYRSLVGKSPLQIRAYWSKLVFSGRAKPPIQVDNTAALQIVLANQLNGIAYVAAQDYRSEWRILLEIPAEPIAP